MAVKRKSGRPVKVPGEKSTKEKIFDAALDLFAERGYDGVSTRDIAAAVGIKDSSIYKHYASKDEILEKILEYPLTRLTKIGPPGVIVDFTMIGKVSPEEEIVSRGLEGYMALGNEINTSWMDDPRMEKVFRIIYVELYHNERVKNFYSMFMEGMYTFCVSFFTIMVERKLIKPADPKVLAMEYLSFYGSAYTDYFLFRYGSTSGSFLEEYRERIDQHTAFMVDAIKPK